MLWCAGNNQRSKKVTKEDRKKKIEEKRLAKKQRVKEMFNAEYDKATNGDGPENKFDSRKAELDLQAKVGHCERQGRELGEKKSVIVKENVGHCEKESTALRESK